MTKGQGVICVNYIDAKISSNPVTFVPNGIFFNVYRSEVVSDFGWLF